MLILPELDKLTWKYRTPSTAPSSTPSPSFSTASVSASLLSSVLVFRFFFVWLLIRREQINERFKC